MEAADAGAAAPAGDGGGAPPEAPSAEPSGSREPAQAPPVAMPEDDPAGAGEGAAGAAPKGDMTAQVKAQMFKIKRGGQEAEYSLEDLQQMVSDDYRHKLPAGGREIELTYPELVRHAQMGVGAFDKMRAAKEERDRWLAQVDYAKKNVPWFMERVLGVDDHLQWAAQVVQARMKEDAELAQLREENPFEFNRRVEARVAAQLEQKNAFDRQRQELDAQRKQQAEERAELARRVFEAINGLGLPKGKDGTPSLTIQNLAGKIHADYQSVDHPLEPEQLAQLARQEYVGEVLGWIDEMPDEALLEMLGDKRRERLRKAEIARVKGAGKAAAAPADNGRKAPTPRSKDDGDDDPKSWLNRKLRELQ